MAEPQVWADGTAGTVIGASVWNVRTVLATDWSGGRLTAYGIENGAVSPWGDGYTRPEGIAIRGDEALIAEQVGTLLRQDLLTPGVAGATPVATGLGDLHAVVWSDDGATAQLTDRAGGRLIEVDLASGAVRDVAVGLSAPLGLAIGTAGEAYVTEQGTGSLTRIDIDGTRTPVATGLVSPFLLAWTDETRTVLLVTERAPAHRVSRIEPGAPAPALERLVGRGITQPSQAIVCSDRLVVTGQGRLLSLDASTGLDPGVRLVVPAEPLWPGAWVDVAIDTGVTGWTRADLEVLVDPPGVITISPHPSTDADPTRPTVRLLAGGDSGTARLVARDAMTNAELGSSEVRVGFDVDPLLDGPALWVESPTEPPAGLRVLAATRGLDDAGSLQPKDTSGAVIPSWRVVAVLVDTGDAVWPTTVTPTTPAPTVADARTTWRDVFTGANGLNTFYREISNGRLGMTLVSGGVLGPVSLGGKWADWHVKAAAGWDIKDEVVPRVVGALQGTPGVDWTQVDAVFVIMRSAGANIVWPYAKEKVIGCKVKAPNGSDVDIKVGRVAMPHNQTTAPSLGFTNVEVSAHELGHTLGLDDIYMSSGFSDGMAARDLSQRELMGNESGLPHFCARHKQLLGFLDPGHVRPFTLGFAEADQFVDLVPIASGLPPAGTFSAVALNIAPGLTWFFEFRQAVAGKIGDTTTFTAGGEILGYDAVTYRKPPVSAEKRRPIILLLDDGDGQGPILTNAEDYESLDAADPNNIERFRLEVVSITPGAARVKVSVGRVDQPDPVLLNNNGEKGDYKSPDIEIRNAVSDVMPRFLNVPIVGVANRVVAMVHNEGGLDAPKVSVRFQVLPVSTDDSESPRWQPLAGPAGEPAIVHDVNAGKRVEFQVQWTPESDRHHCVQARIDRYVRVPGAVADEPDVDNNLAQSNYFTFISKPSSPATREYSWIDVHNPHDHDVDAWIELVQDSTVYRSYVDHRWLHLAPGETRQVRLEVESKATSIWDAIERHWPDGNTWLRSWLPGQGCTAKTGTGVSVGVSTAVASNLRVLESGPGFVQLRLEGPAGAPHPPSGSVAVLVDYEDGTQEALADDVDGFGTVVLRPQRMNGRGRAFFTGAPGYAPVHDWEFEVRGD